MTGAAILYNVSACMLCVKERLLFIHCGSVPFKATSRQYLTAFTAAAPMLNMKHLKVYANISYNNYVSASEAATARHAHEGSVR